MPGSRNIATNTQTAPSNYFIFEAKLYFDFAENQDLKRSENDTETMPVIPEFINDLPVVKNANLPDYRQA